MSRDSGRGRPGFGKTLMQENFGLIFRTLSGIAGKPREPNLSILDDRQITHLICDRLKHLLYDFFGGRGFWASFLLFFLHKRPKTPPKKVI